MRAGIVLAISFVGLLADPSWSAPKPPPISGLREEEKDPDFTRDPAKKDLINLVIHLSDAITDKYVKENNVPGMDFFVDNLQAELRRNGNDSPRNDILNNAREARRELRDAYADLKKALLPLIAARDPLEEVDEELKKLLAKNGENLDKVREVSDKLKELVAQMRADPPDSPGEKVDPSLLKDVEGLSSYLEPLPEKLKQASKKIGEAKPWIDTAKHRVEALRRLGEKAGELDDTAMKHLSERRTRGLPADYSPDFTSRKVIENANDWLSKCVEKALKVHELMESLTEPGKGLDKTVSDMMEANAKTQAAKETALEQVPAADQEHQRIREDIRPAWQRAKTQEEKQKQVRRAEQAKAKAEEASKKTEDSVKQAEEQYKKAKGSADKAAEDMKKLQELLGKEPADDLAEIEELFIDVPDPSGPKDLGSRRNGKKTASKPLRWPKVLDDSPERVIQEYGERR
ncbi:MAG: hypothetical protein WC728_01525 [Elusimicrobiota bacterium]